MRVRVTRRDFLKYCLLSASALGLSTTTVMKLKKALAKEVLDPATGTGIPVIWIQAAACSGCVTSVLNSVKYTTIYDLLFETIDLDFMTTVMSAAGVSDPAVYTGANALDVTQALYSDTVNFPYFVLVVEGSVQEGLPAGTTGEYGEFCIVGDLSGSGPVSTITKTPLAQESAYKQIHQFAARATFVLALGTCACFGGIPAAKGNKTDAKGLLYDGLTGNINSAPRKAGTFIDPATKLPYAQFRLGNSTNPIKPAKVVNIPGCPPHPDWVIGTIAHIIAELPDALTNFAYDNNPLALAQALPSLDSLQRPLDYGYKDYQCNAGPCTWRYNNTPSRVGSPEPDWNSRYPTGDSMRLGRKKWTNTDQGCLGILGCKGRKTHADCSRRRWNAYEFSEYGMNWCVGSRAGCHGCTEPAFPDKVGKFFTIL